MPNNLRLINHICRLLLKKFYVLFNFVFKYKLDKKLLSKEHKIKVSHISFDNASYCARFCLFLQTCDSYLKLLKIIKNKYYIKRFT